MKKEKQHGVVREEPANYGNSISTNDLRFQFDRVLTAMRRGVPLTLTYRNRPLARILPVRDDEGIVDGDDPAYHFHECSEPMGSLTNRQIDDSLYRNA
jgi:prevent-host-death family protein